MLVKKKYGTPPPEMLTVTGSHDKFQIDEIYKMSSGVDLEDLAVHLTKKMSQQNNRPSLGLRKSLRSDDAK